MSWVAVALLLAAPGEATPSGAERCRALLAELRYKQALLCAEEGLEVGDAHPPEVQSLYLVVAESSAALNLLDASRTAFEHVLLLNPSFQLSSLASPKLREPFGAARRSIGDARLKAMPVVLPIGASRYRARVIIEGDRFHWVHGGTLYVQRGADFVPVELVPAEELRAELECPVRCGYFVVLRDASGNALLELGSSSALLFPELPEAAPAAVTSAPAPPRVWYRHPATYGVLAALFAAAGGVLAWQYSATEQALISANADRPNHTLAELQGVDSLRLAEHTGIFVCAGLAVVAAVVAIAVW
jgi:hypothetical protein